MPLAAMVQIAAVVVASAATAPAVAVAAASAATAPAVLAMAMTMTMTMAVVVASAATAPAVAVVVASAATAPAVAVAAASVATGRAVEEVKTTSRPSLASGVLHFHKAGKNLFFVPDIPNWMVVNDNAAILLFSCDGKSRVADIISALELAPELQANALDLFEEAARRGVLHTGSLAQTDGTRCDKRQSVTGIRTGPLRSVYLKLTDECNLACKYCYANSSGKKSQILSLADLQKIASEIAEISNSVEYVLSGGEPLLNPHALDFAEAMTDAGNGVQLLTNGVLVDSDSMAKRIAACTNMVKISVDGSADSVHSLGRGKHNFNKVTRAVELLQSHGANVLVAMTVTKKNVHDLENMSSKYGSRLALQPLFMAGRGEKESDWGLTGDEYYEAMAEVDGIAPMGNVARTLERLRGRGVTRCALAEREISISETGDVFPCQLLHAPEFLSGNIHQQHIKEIYFNSPVLERMRAINVNTIEECSECPIRLICGGGCRARDYYESGSVDAVGEFCAYEKQAFIGGLLDGANFDV